MAGTKLRRKFGGKIFDAESGHKTYNAAQRKAEKLRRQGKKVRVVPASKHDRVAHGVFWEVFTRG